MEFLSLIVVRNKKTEYDINMINIATSHYFKYTFISIIDFIHLRHLSLILVMTKKKGRAKKDNKIGNLLRTSCYIDLFSVDERHDGRHVGLSPPLYLLLFLAECVYLLEELHEIF